MWPRPGPGANAHKNHYTLENGDSLRLTNTEIAILKVLSDGMRHSREEVKGVLDRMATYKNLHDHIVRIRKKLEPKNQTVVCELNGGRIWYRHVRFICDPDYD